MNVRTDLLQGHVDALGRIFELNQALGSNEKDQIFKANEFIALAQIIRSTNPNKTNAQILKDLLMFYSNMIECR